MGPLLSVNNALFDSETKIQVCIEEWKSRVESMNIMRGRFIVGTFLYY